MRIYENEVVCLTNAMLNTFPLAIMIYIIING